MKYLGRSVLIAMICLLSALLFLIGTSSGLRAGLVIADRLAGPQIHIDAEVLKGRLLGGGTLQNIRFKSPALTLGLERAEIAWLPARLLSGVLEIKHLKLSAGQLAIHKSDTDDTQDKQSANWLPNVNINNADIDSLQIAFDEQSLQIERFNAAASLLAGQLEISRARLTMPGLTAKASGKADLQNLFITGMQLEWGWQTAELVNPVSGTATIQGDADKLVLAATLSSPTQTILNMELTNISDMPSWRAEIMVAQMNLQQDLMASLPDVDLGLKGSTTGNAKDAKLNATGNIIFDGVTHPWQLDAAIPLNGDSLPTLNLVSGQAQARIEPDEINSKQANVLLDIPEFAELWPGLAGQFNAELTTTSKLPGDQIDAVVRKLSFNHELLGAWHTRAESTLGIADGGGRLTGLCLQQNDATLCSDLTWQGSRIDASLDIESLQLQTVPLLAKFDEYQFSGLLAGNLRTALDNRRVEQLDANLKVSEGLLSHHLESGQSTTMKFRSAALHGKEQSGQLHLQASLIDDFGASLDASLKIPVDLETILLPEMPLQGQLTIDLQQLDSIGVFVPELSLPAGNLTAAIQLAGTMRAPRFNGEAELQVPVFEAGETAMTFRQTKLTMELENEKISLTGQSLLADNPLRLNGRGQIVSIDDWNASVQLSTQGIPVSAIPLLSQQEDITLAGLLRLDLELALNNTLTIDHLDGELRLNDGVIRRSFFDGDMEQVEIRDLRIVSVKKQDTLSFEGHLLDKHDGKLSIEMALPAHLPSLAEPDLPMRGKFSASFPHLDAFVIFLDDVTLPQGTFMAEFDLAGTRTAPLLRGSAALQVPRLDLAEPAISFDDTRLNLEFANNKVTAKGGSHISGRQLMLEGNAEFIDIDAWEANIELAGSSIRLEDIFGSSLQTSPELSLAITPGELRLAGDIELESSEIFIPDISSTVRPSSDVNIVSAEAPVPPWRIATDLNLRLSGNNRLRVAGFNGLLGGNVRIRSETGRLTSGEGALTVKQGEYRAFGATVPIRRGRLEFIGGELDDPAIQIQSRRRVEQREVGFDVSGTLQSPVVTLVSNPAMDQSEILSWLLYGRASGVTNGASTALLAGSINQLLGREEEESFMQRMFNRMGLTGVGVEADLTGGLRVSKQLSPRLFVKTEVDVWEQTNRLILRYLLNEHWALEGIGGDEGGGDILYEREN
mgnify:FL=1